MSTKKEKVEFVRTEQFEAVEEELMQAMGLLEEKNAQIIALLESESRGDLPFLETGAEPEAPEASVADAAGAAPKKATPRVRRGGETRTEAD